MIQSLRFGAGLVALLSVVACTKAPGAVCRDASGRSIENPDYCSQSISQHPAARNLAYCGTSSQDRTDSPSHR